MNIEKARQLAKDETTPAEMLVDLAKSEDYETRKCVAANPNTPEDILQRLGLEFPEEIIDNPIFSLLWLEKPDSKFIKLSLARSLRTNSETLAKLTESKENDILYAIACNLNTPVYILEKLADWTPIRSRYGYDDSYSNYVSAGVAANPKTPLSILEKLASHHDGFVRQTVVQNKNTSVKILEKLADDLDERVHLAIAQNINTPTSILEILAVIQERELRNSILKHPNMTDSVLNIMKFVDGKSGVYPSTLEKLANYPKLKIRQMVADHIYTPTNTLEQLAEEDDPKILKYISIHPNVSLRVLEKLASRLIVYAKQDKRIETKSRVNRNTYILSRCYLNLIKNSQLKLEKRLQLFSLINLIINTRDLIGVAKCSTVDSTILLVLAEDQRRDLYVLELWLYLAKNPNTPDEAINTIYLKLKQYEANSNNNNQTGIIRRLYECIYHHPNTSSFTLEEMAKNQKENKYFVAANPLTSSNVLRELALIPDSRLRLLVINHKNVPLDVLKKLSQDLNFGIKFEVAKSINTPIHILEMLAEEKSIYTKIALSRNPKLPVSILESLAREQKYKIRINVAANPNTPTHILDLLADDLHPEVRLNVVKNNNTSDITLLRITENNKKFEKIQLALLERELTARNILPERILIELIESYYSLSTMERIAKNPHTSEFYLEYLAFNFPSKTNLDRDLCLQTIQKCVADNINASVTTLEQLAESSNREIIVKARKTLKAKFSVSSLYRLKS